MDRVRFAMRLSAEVTLEDIAGAARISKHRALAALRALQAAGRVRLEAGHHHGDGTFCQCSDGESRGLPAIHHWLEDET